MTAPLPPTISPNPSAAAEVPTPVVLSPQQIKRNRWMLLGVVIVFVLPVASAYLGYFGGWFDGFTRANRGELLQPIQNIAEYPVRIGTQAFTTETMNKKWWLVLVHDGASCVGDCEKLRMYTLNQTWIALGKEQERVVPAVLTNETSATALTLPEKWQGLQAEIRNGVIQDAAGQRQLHAAWYYIVDPMGSVVLRYRAPVSEQEAAQRYKDIKADFSKLLKFSHIG